MSEPTSVLIISHDVVGARMAGPGIRYRELARVLSHYFRVTLAVPEQADLSLDDIDLWTYTPGQWNSLAPAVERADTVLTCGDVLAWFPMLQEAGLPLIVDGYDPHTFETLAMFAGTPEQAQKHQERERILQMQCQAGDFFICASERQRDWWLGLLEGAGRINVHTYGQDRSLQRLVDVVPFGLPSSPPHHARQVLKGIWPGIGPEDKVVLWGGGIWQWLDPLTAIRAVALVQEQRSDVKLVFPGTRHPHRTGIPDMPMRRDAVRLAEELGLLDRCVFFGDWVLYEEWPNYLVESDIGLSLHFDNLETRLAFRSRLLDYVWAGLSMVVTRGDATSELVSRFELGETVDYERQEKVADALLRLLETPKADLFAHFERARVELTWEKAAAPLVAYCRHPRRAPDRGEGVKSSSVAWAWEELAAQPSTELEALRTTVAQQDAQIVHLRKTIEGFEQGRFMRLMRRFHKTWQRVLNRHYIVSALDLVRTARFYQQLVREVGRASSHAFVDRAYWRVLRRAPDTAGFTHYVDMLAKGQCSRRDVVLSLVQSTEFRTQPRPIYDITEALHQVRFQLVSQLPAADHVLDLGGAAPSSIQGALLVMGYPHHVRSLTIVDLPPDDRLGDHDCGSSEKAGDWIDTEMGPVRYLHTSMTDLSAIESNSIDLVFAGQSIEHVSEKDGRSVMREVFRLLRPGGHFCLDTPNGLLARILSPDVIIHPEHQFEYRVDELVTRLRDVGFEIVEVKGICPMPRTVQTGVFDEQELFANAHLSDDAENSYLFYVKCTKPE